MSTFMLFSGKYIAFAEYDFFHEGKRYYVACVFPFKATDLVVLNGNYEEVSDPRLKR